MKPSEKFFSLTKENFVYNIQAIENIPSIMRRGLLSNEKAGKIVHKSIAMPVIQERRETVAIPNGMPLHKYANVYFDPRNPMLYKRKDDKCNICIMKLSKEILDIEGTIISDRNASSRYASFYPTRMGLDKIDFSLVYAKDWRDADTYKYYEKKSVKCAEILVPDAIPYEYVVSAAVYDEKTKEKLKNTGFDKDIFVQPEIFF